MELQVRLFGSFLLTINGAPPATLPRARVRDLLAYLVLHRTSAVPRIVLASALWPDVRDEQALKNLRTLLTRLRDDLPELDEFLLVNADSVRLRVDESCQVDVVLFEEARARGLVALGNSDAHSALRAFSDAASHYGGDLLPGHDDEWIRFERERLQRAWFDTLDQRARLFSNAGAHQQAQEVARQLLHADPLHESAYGILMRSQLALGDRAGALRSYHACAALLRDELGVDPGGETQAVYEEVLFEDRRATTTPALARGQAVVEVATVQRTLLPGAQQWVVASAPLVGREKSMAWLREHWAVAQTGAPQIVLLAGEAGIGKTRLVQEFASRVEREGEGEVAIARAYAAGATAYAPIAAWLRSYAGSRRFQRAAAQTRVEVARLVPEYADSATVEPLDEAWRRHRFYQAMATALVGERDESPAPLLLILEDAQWADAETLAWLPQLLEVAQNKPLLMLLTLRLEEAPENAPLERLLRELRRTSALHERELRRLNFEETTQLANMLLAEQTDWGQPAAFGAKLYDETEGVPLFVVETVRAGLVDAALHASESAGVEDTLQLSPAVLATLRSRLAQVSQPARELVECAAVLGRDFRYAELAHASHLDEDSVVRGVDELWRKRIVREQGADAYDFSHDKLRAVAYGDLSSARRRLLHRRAAEAVIEGQGNAPESSAQIAAHFEEAGDLAHALHYLVLAARVAKSLFAREEAELLTRILSPKYASLLSTSDRVDHLMMIGEIHNRDNRVIEAEAVYRDAVRLAATLDAPLTLARARAGLGYTFVVQGKYEIGVASLQSELAIFETEGSHGDVVRVLNWIHEVYYERGEYEPAMEVLERVLQSAEALGDDVAFVDALAKMADIVSTQGKQALWNEKIQRVLAVSESIGYRPGLISSHFQLAITRPDLVGVVEGLIATALEAREIGDRNSYQGCLSFLCYALTMRGEPLRGVSGFLQGIAYNVAAESWFNACAQLFWGNYVIHLGGWHELAERVYQVLTEATRRIHALRLLYMEQLLYAVLLVDMGKIDEAEAQLSDLRSRGVPESNILWYGFDFRCLSILLDGRIAAARGDFRASLFDEARAFAVESGDPLLDSECAYWCWKYTEDAERKDAAAHALRAAYNMLGDMRVRQRYLEVTGEILPEPPPLPDLSAHIPPALTVDELYEQVHSILEQIAAIE